MDDIEIPGHADEHVVAGDEDELLVVGRPGSSLDAAVDAADDLELGMSAWRAKIYRKDIRARGLGRRGRGSRCRRRRGGGRGRGRRGGDRKSVV